MRYTSQSTVGGANVWGKEIVLFSGKSAVGPTIGNVSLTSQGTYQTNVVAIDLSLTTPSVVSLSLLPVNLPPTGYTLSAAYTTSSSTVPWSD
jgi:hypothetical protein